MAENSGALSNDTDPRETLRELYRRLSLQHSLATRQKDEIKQGKLNRREYYRLKAADDQKPWVPTWYPGSGAMTAWQSALRRMDVEIQATRASINDIWRLLIRPIQFSEMPDEILLRIFGYLRGISAFEEQKVHDSSDNKGIQSIQCVRLTCRRFCAISSEYLLNFLSVDSSNESLERLEEVSKHVTIRKGIRALDLQVGLYNHVMASEKGLFENYHSARISHHLCEIDSSKLINMGIDLRRQYPNSVGRMEKIAKAWSDSGPECGEATLTEEEAAAYRSLLERGFAGYQRKFDEERELIDSGAFTARVVKAIEEMGQVVGLQIHVNNVPTAEDVYPCRQVPFYQQILDNDKLYEALIADNRHIAPNFTAEFSSEDIFVMEVSPVLCISALLAGLDSSQVKVMSLEIYLSAPADAPSLLGTTVENRLQVASTLRNLTTFSLLIHETPLPRSRDELRAVRDFLEPVLNSGNIEDLSVDLNLWSDYSALDPASFGPSVGVIKATLGRMPLRRLALHGLPIHFSDLEHLLNSFRSGHRCVSLGQVHLLDGSWAALLDILKERHRWPRLVGPSGAECEHLGPEEYVSIFGRYECYRYFPRFVTSEAERYNLGLRVGNPLRGPEPE